jgi:hypothetical protein
MIKIYSKTNENRYSMLIFGERPGKIDMPTKMALALGLSGLKMKNGWHHRVPHEKIYKLCWFDGSTLKTFGSELAWCNAK